MFPDNWFEDIEFNFSINLDNIDRFSVVDGYIINDEPDYDKELARLLPQISFVSLDEAAELRAWYDA